jgi:hypothetical protein
MVDDLAGAGDDLAGARDDAVGHGVAGGDEERNLGFWCWGS